MNEWTPWAVIVLFQVNVIALVCLLPRLSREVARGYFSEKFAYRVLICDLKREMENDCDGRKDESEGKSESGS